ncbi:MAG: hypothetical protein AAGG56_01830 [Pseudomonadota bacterium]
MAAIDKGPVFGGLSLILVCFLGSAGLRFADSAHAFSDEISEMAAFYPAAGAIPNVEEPVDSSDALLQAIKEREVQLDRKDRQLADREQELRVAEQKLAEQLAAFEIAQRNLEETLALADGAAERDIERMKTVYESMKPAEAALIFQQMETSFAAGLLARMRPEIAANVMGAMEPDAAYAVTLTIASRNTDVPIE